MEEDARQAAQEQKAGKRSKAGKLIQVDEEEDVRGDKADALVGKVSGGVYLRHCFFGSLAFQFLSYAVLTTARRLDRPAREGFCNQTASDSIGDCELRALEGHCYSERPGGDAALTRRVVFECCASCSGGPLESGGGMLYYICIAGMAVWGYQFGFLKSYLHRGKDALGRKKDETLHEANVKLQWHSNHLFFPAAKAIVATVFYFLSVLSLLYYYVPMNGNCPTSPIEAITSTPRNCHIITAVTQPLSRGLDALGPCLSAGMDGEGFVLWLVVTIFYAPVMVAELFLLFTHFELWRKYQKIVSQYGVGRMTWKS